MMNRPNVCDSHCPPMPSLISQTVVVLATVQSPARPLERRVEGLAKLLCIPTSKRCRELPRGNCLISVLFLLPAVHTSPSSLHLLQGDSPSHLVFLVRHLSHAFQTLLCLPSNTTELFLYDELDLFEVLSSDLEGFGIFLDRCDLLSGGRQAVVRFNGELKRSVGCEADVFEGRGGYPSSILDGRC